MAKKGVRLLWSGPALADLDTIRLSVSRDKPSAAKKLAASIRHGVNRLRKYPRLGRPMPEFPSSELREVIVSPYRVVYTIREKQVVILRVWHSSQHLGAEDVPG